MAGSDETSTPRISGATELVLAWDPIGCTLNAANLAGRMPWTAHLQPGPPSG